jgi:hypothetical protein
MKIFRHGPYILIIEKGLVLFHDSHLDVSLLPNNTTQGYVCTYNNQLDSFFILS